jgi:hypothetical protein
MKLPRKAILIRLVIYVPLLAFATWYFMFRGGGADEAAAPASSQPAPGKRRTMTMPDGSEVHYLELTPEEARQMGLDPEPPEEASPAEAAAKDEK